MSPIKKVLSGWKSPLLKLILQNLTSVFHSATAPEPGHTVGASARAQKPHAAARRGPYPVSVHPAGGRTEAGGVHAPATDCESAWPAGEVCGEKERRKVSTEQWWQS